MSLSVVYDGKVKWSGTVSPSLSNRLLLSLSPSLSFALSISLPLYFFGDLGVLKFCGKKLSSGATIAEPWVPPRLKGIRFRYNDTGAVSEAEREREKERGKKEGERENGRGGWQGSNARRLRSFENPFGDIVRRRIVKRWHQAKGDYGKATFCSGEASRKRLRHIARNIVFSLSHSLSLFPSLLFSLPFSLSPFLPHTTLHSLPPIYSEVSCTCASDRKGKRLFLNGSLPIFSDLASSAGSLPHGSGRPPYLELHGGRITSVYCGQCGNF